MKKSLGSKRKEISPDQCDELIKNYHNFQENKFTKIFNNEFFGYTKVTIEQPTIKNGKVVKDKKGNPKPDTKLRDTERIPLTDDIEEYYNREVKPHLPNSWMDREKDKVGYEINFTKYFYEYKPLRSLKEITSDLLELEKESEGIFKEIVNEEV
jgi:type I restriction enzyme M protein